MCWHWRKENDDRDLGTRKRCSAVLNDFNKNFLMKTNREVKSWCWRQYNDKCIDNICSHDPIDTIPKCRVKFCHHRLCLLGAAKKPPPKKKNKQSDIWDNIHAVKKLLSWLDYEVQGPRNEHQQRMHAKVFERLTHLLVDYENKKKK